MPLSAQMIKLAVILHATIFTRWGAKDCPESSKKLYDGFVANGGQNNGGGLTSLCMHPEPQFPRGFRDENNAGAYLYGVEYMNTGTIDKNQYNDAACAVCEHMKASSVYVQWGRRNCSNGHNLEYEGLIMSSYVTHKKQTNVCVDLARDVQAGSSGNNEGGGYWYTSEMHGGHNGAANYQQYGGENMGETTYYELACAVCSPNNDKRVYTRWGKRSCPESTTHLYEGFMAAAHTGHTGGGANFICMHPEPQFPEGYHKNNVGSNYLYGAEYRDSQSMDKNHCEDASCSVCEHKTSSSVYIQWGRVSCSDGHHTEYTGIIMAAKYTEYKTSFVCVDLAREPRKDSDMYWDSSKKNI